MSDQAYDLVDAIEEAIRAWFEDSHSDEEHPRNAKGDVVVDWVVGFTISNVVDVDGREVVGYANMHIAPLGNPNAHVALAAWVADDISEILHPGTED